MYVAKFRIIDKEGNSLREESIKDLEREGATRKNAKRLPLLQFGKAERLEHGSPKVAAVLVLNEILFNIMRIAMFVFGNPGRATDLRAPIRGATDPLSRPL